MGWGFASPPCSRKRSDTSKEFSARWGYRPWPALGIPRGGPMRLPEKLAWGSFPRRFWAGQEWSKKTAERKLDKSFPGLRGL